MGWAGESEGPGEGGGGDKEREGVAESATHGTPSGPPCNHSLFDLQLTAAGERKGKKTGGHSNWASPPVQVLVQMRVKSVVKIGSGLAWTGCRLASRPG